MRAQHGVESTCLYGHCLEFVLKAIGTKGVRT